MHFQDCPAFILQLRAPVLASPDLSNLCLLCPALQFYIEETRSFNSHKSNSVMSGHSAQSMERSQPVAAISCHCDGQVAQVSDLPGVKLVAISTTCKLFP